MLLKPASYTDHFSLVAFSLLHSYIKKWRVFPNQAAARPVLSHSGKGHQILTFSNMVGKRVRKSYVEYSANIQYNALPATKLL